LRRSSEQQEVDDEVSSFEEVKVQKKLVKEGEIDVVENPRFMTEARRKELERRQRQKEESMPVVKEENRKFSLFPHQHHRSKFHPAAAIQQPAVEQEQQVQGESPVPPPSEGSPSKAAGSPSKPSSSPSKGWFISSLKGFFGPRQLPSPTRQRSTKSTKTTTTTVIINNLPSDDSDVEVSPNPRVFPDCSGPPRSKN
jgi:hypothetical protein